jgi:hypothetical protein
MSGIHGLLIVEFFNSAVSTAFAFLVTAPRLSQFADGADGLHVAVCSEWAVEGSQSGHYLRFDYSRD